MKNWARYANRWNIAWWLFFGVLVTMGVVKNQFPGFGAWLAASGALFCFVQVANAATGKLVVTDDKLLIRTWFRERSVDLRDISSLVDTRWDGGWFIQPSGPRRIRVLQIRLKRSHGEVMVLEHAHMPPKHLDQLVTEIRLRAPQKIKGYDPANQHQQDRFEQVS